MYKANKGVVVVVVVVELRAANASCCWNKNNKRIEKKNWGKCLLKLFSTQRIKVFSLG